MPFGGDDRNRRHRLNDPEPFTGTPLSMQVSGLEQQLAQERDEMARLMKDLVTATQRAEAAEARREEDQGEINKLRKQVEFYRERSVMMMKTASGLIATVRGMIPSSGSQVLNIFKSLSDAVEKQLEDLTLMVKDHMAGSKEFLERQRAEDANQASDRKHVNSFGKVMTDAIRQSQRTGVRTLDDIEQEMQDLVQPREGAYATRAPTEQLGAAQPAEEEQPAPQTERSPNGTR